MVSNLGASYNVCTFAKMNFKEARSIVLHEGTTIEGMVVEIRMGRFPDRPRIEALINSLKEVRSGLVGVSTIERELAHALYCIGFHIQGHVDGMLSAGAAIPEGFDEHMVVIFNLVDEIFEGHG